MKKMLYMVFKNNTKFKIIYGMSLTYKMSNKGSLHRFGLYFRSVLYNTFPYWPAHAYIVFMTGTFQKIYYTLSAIISVILKRNSIGSIQSVYDLPS